MSDDNMIETKVILWSLPMENGARGVRRTAVYADFTDPDFDDDRPLFRDGLFLENRDFSYSIPRMMHSATVLDLVERVEVIGTAMYRLRYDLPPEDYDFEAGWDLGN